MIDTTRNDAHGIELETDHFDDAPETLSFHDWAVKLKKGKKIPHDEALTYWHKWGGEYLDYCQREQYEAEDVGETITGKPTLFLYAVHADDWGYKRIDHLYSWHGLIGYLYSFEGGARIRIEQIGTARSWNFDMAADNEAWEEAIPKP